MLHGQHAGKTTLSDVSSRRLADGAPARMAGRRDAKLEVGGDGDGDSVIWYRELVLVRVLYRSAIQDTDSRGTSLRKMAAPLVNPTFDEIEEQDG